jgi:hypothetical protein
LVDAGDTGVQFDMTKPNPHGNDLAILSPYATRVHRRWSLPDAIRSFLLNWPAKPKPSTQNPRLETTCLGYDGVTGERQFNIDTKAAGSVYATSNRDANKLRTMLFQPLPNPNCDISVIAHPAVTSGWPRRARVMAWRAPMDLRRAVSRTERKSA